MCICIAKSATKEISKETLNTCWDHNPDGAGYMYNVNGRLKIKKGFFTFKDFWNSYSNSVHNKGIKSVIHFRIKTHGDINFTNCHPFRIDEHTGFVHNGIIRNVDTQNDKEKSDTWHFNEKILKPMSNRYAGILETDSMQMLLGEYIESSKLIFLNDQDKMWVTNPNLGEMHDGCWYSNSSYKERKVIQYKHKQPTYNPANNIVLKQGLIFELSSGYKTYQKGTEGIITSVNQNHTVNAELFNQGDYMHSVDEFNIPVFFIDPIKGQV